MKRGMSHIEVVLAFILFIGSIASVLYLIQPIEKKDLGSSLQYALREFERNSETTVETYFIKIYRERLGKDIISINSSGMGDLKASAEGYSGKLLPTRRDEGFVYVNISGEDSIYLRFSEEFTDSLEKEHYSPFNESFYSLGANNANRFISEKKLLEFNKTYYEEYSRARDIVGLGKTAEFSFAVYFSDSAIKAERKVPVGANVYSNSKREEILRTDGSIVFGEVIMKTW